MKKCVRCGAENNGEFKYCKFCGAELPCVDRKVYGFYGSESENTKEKISPSSEDITITEMVRFVGKNNGQIVPKFISQQQTGKKLAWCLPAFLWGLFFGLPGIAIWFLYRKMIKPAAVLLSVSAAFAVINMIFTYPVMVEYYEGLISAMGFYNNMLGQNPTTALEGLSGYLGELTSRLGAAMEAAVPKAFTFVTDFVANFAAPIVVSLFGIWIYKGFCLKKISHLKRITESEVLYPHYLSRTGGTSVGYAVIGVVLYFVFTTALSFIPLISVLIG